MKELLGMELGYRESAESWAGALRGLRKRGMEAPLLVVGDGALGLWSALDDVFPTTAHQRCWNHRALNVQAKLPKALCAEARRRLREMSVAGTRSERERLRDEYVVELRSAGRIDAAETMVRDWESFVSFYDFPMEPWLHLRTTNPLGSVFSAVRLKTEAARRLKRRDSALYLALKVALRLSGRWRQLNGGRNMMKLLLEGAKYEDGILTELPLVDAVSDAGLAQGNGSSPYYPRYRYVSTEQSAQISSRDISKPIRISNINPTAIQEFRNYYSDTNITEDGFAHKVGRKHKVNLAEPPRT